MISGAAVDAACTGTVVAVNAAGQATVTVPAMGAVGIDVNAMATAAVEIVTATASTSLSYKYDLGGSWDNVEETASCGDVANRTMSVDGGSVDDTVAAWAGLGGC